MNSQATEEKLTVGVFQDVDIIFKEISDIFIDMRKHQNDIFPEFSAEQLLKQDQHVLGICVQSFFVLNHASVLPF
jgi:hypothetical protein